MTELGETAEELREQIASLTAEVGVLRQDLDSLSYSVAHDLAAPLRAIASFSEALAEDYADRLGEEGADYLRRVRSSAAFMQQLLDALLELSHVSRAVVRRELADITGMARSVAISLAEAHPERTVDVIIAENLSATGDPVLLRTCFEHLIGNAFKFTSRTPSARIEVGSEERDGHRSIFVRDNGAGFDQVYAEGMFGAFQQLHPRSQFEGIGMGLTLALRIVHKHGGTIRAEGRPNEGATIYVELP